jgi:prophage regulatory protein
MSGLSRSTIWRLERRGLFPKRVRISEGVIGWRLSELQAWVAGRGQESTEPEMSGMLKRRTAPSSATN